LRRWWWLVAVFVIAGVALVFVTLPDASGELTPEDLADPDSTFRSTQILIRDGDSSMAPSLDLVMLLARQGELTNRVVQEMGGEVTAPEVEEVELEADENIDTLAVTAVHRDPDRSELLARTYARELNDLLVERATTDLEEERRAAEQQVDELREEVRDLQNQIAPLAEGDPERQLQEAELDGLLNRYAAAQTQLQELQSQQIESEVMFGTLQEPTAVNTKLDEDEATLSLPRGTTPRLLLALVGSLFLGVGSVFLLDHLDTRIRTRRDVEAAFGLPVIADLPARSRKAIRDQPLPVRSEPGGVTSEAFRSLRLSVTLAPTWKLSGATPTNDGSLGSAAAVHDHESPRSLLVTSSIMGEGKTTLVANLAASLAESGQRVLVVDCDFRRPAVDAMLGAERAPGLRSLEDPLEKPMKDLVVPTRVENVALLPAGKPGLAPSWFLSHSQNIIEQAEDIADVTLLDTGPMLLTNEAIALVPAVEAVILVNRASKVTYEQARATVEQLSRVSANVAGVVMVGGDGPRRYRYYESQVNDDGWEEARTLSLGAAARRPAGKRPQQGDRDRKPVWP
jgi:capsular exopolysaccharide synthesis family protein